MGSPQAEVEVLASVLATSAARVVTCRAEVWKVDVTVWYRQWRPGPLAGARGGGAPPASPRLAGARCCCQRALAPSNAEAAPHVGSGGGLASDTGLADRSAAAGVSAARAPRRSGKAACTAGQGTGWKTFVGA